MSNLAPSVTPRPVKNHGTGRHQQLTGGSFSPTARAGRTYTPSTSPVKMSQQSQRSSGPNPFSFAAAAAVAGGSGTDLLSPSSKAYDSIRVAEAAASLSPRPPSLRKKQLIVSGDSRNLDSNFAIATVSNEDRHQGATQPHVVVTTLARLGIPVSIEDAQALLYEFEETNDAGLRYDAFVEDLVQLLRQSSLQKTGSNRTALKKTRLPLHIEKLSAMQAVHVQTLQTLLSDKLRVSWSTVRDTFRSADPEHKGFVSKRMFADLCHKLEVPIPNVVLESLVVTRAPGSRSLDSDSSVVDYNDFLASFGADFQHNDPNTVSSSLAFERSGAFANKRTAAYGIHDAASPQSVVNHTLWSPGVSSVLGGRVQKPATASPSSSTQQYDPLFIEQLSIKLRERVTEQYKYVKRAFAASDSDNSGRLSTAEFTRTLQTFHLVASPFESDALLSFLDRTNDGMIDYRAFLTRFRDAHKSSGSELSPTAKHENASLLFASHRDNIASSANRYRHELSSPGTELKDALSQLSDAHWRAVFVELEMSDVRHSGFVPSAELLRVLGKYLGDLPKTHYAALFRACGSHANQLMNYRTLVKSYRPSALDAVTFYRQDTHATTDKAFRKSPTESLVMVWSIRVQRAQLGPGDWQALKDAIATADGRRQGRVCAADFKQVLQRFLKLSADQLAFLCYFYEDTHVANDDVLIRYQSFLTDYEDAGLEDADAVDAAKGSKSKLTTTSRVEGKGRGRSLAQTGGSVIAFTDADRMERAMEEKRLRDFFLVHVRALETLLTNEDIDRRGSVPFDMFLRFCKERNGGKWKDSSVTTTFLRKYVTQRHAQQPQFYYRTFLLDFDQHAGVQTQALERQADGDDNGGEADERSDQFDGDHDGSVATLMDVHEAKDALRHVLTTSLRKQRGVYKLFQRMDVGKSGILTHPELRRALERLGICIDDATARDMFAQFEDDDSDGDRVVGRVKYLQLLHAHGGRDPDKLLDGMSELSSNCSYYSAISISPRAAVRHSGALSPRPHASRDHVAAATAVTNAIEKPRQSGSTNSSFGSGAAAAVAVERKIKLALEAQSKTKWKQVARAFQQIDSDRRGSITPSSFRKVLEDFGVLLDQEELVRLQLKYDIDQNGRIHYAAYLRNLTHSMSDLSNSSGGGSSSSSTTIEQLPSLAGAASPRRALQTTGSAAARSSMVSGVPDTLRQGVRTKWKAIYSSFKTLDKTNAGRVSTAHFRQLLEWYALPVADEVFLRLLRLFDHDDDVGVDYNLFMRTCVGD